MLLYSDFIHFEEKRNIRLLDWQKEYALEYINEFNTSLPTRRFYTERVSGKSFIMIELSKFISSSFRETRSADSDVSDKMNRGLSVEENDNSVFVRAL
jgi:hypothetical protein